MLEPTWYDIINKLMCLQNSCNEPHIWQSDLAFICHSCFFLKYSNGEAACSECFTVLVTGMHSTAVSTSMDAIWELNINSSSITSPSVPPAPWRHWQLHKGTNEIPVNSQSPTHTLCHFACFLKILNALCNYLLFVWRWRPFRNKSLLWSHHI